MSCISQGLDNSLVSSSALGPYPVNNAGRYHVLQRYLELEAEKMNFPDHEAYIEALHEKPQKLWIHTRKMTQPPEPYHADIFPEWPEEGES